MLTYGNLHVYRFSVDHDFTIYASTCSDSTDFDSNIALFDINGNLMQQNDDTGDACGECTADAQHAGWEQAEIYCEDNTLSAGTYILVVGGAESSSGTYGITVQIDPPAGECEATCYGQTCDYWGDDCSSSKTITAATARDACAEPTVAVNGQGCSNYIDMDNGYYGGVYLQGGSTSLEDCAAAIRGPTVSRRRAWAITSFEYAGYCNCPTDDCRLDFGELQPSPAATPALSVRG